ncbi:MAG TPA: hypothetical protein DHV26_06525 [Cytophagales bacterium]|nr:hypothetical protein [Cytophagales bacterium]
MPLNMLKVYNHLLEFTGMSSQMRTQSLLGVFKRDIENNNAFRFRGKRINPTKGEDEPMERLFKHLTTEITDQATRLREFEQRRSERLHWIRHHVEEKKNQGMLVFSVEELGQVRTYILDSDESYVIVLESFRNKTEYYLLTAYYLDGRNPYKMKNKYKRRLPDVI